MLCEHAKVFLVPILAVPICFVSHVTTMGTMIFRSIDCHQAPSACQRIFCGGFFAFMLNFVNVLDNGTNVLIHGHSKLVDHAEGFFTFFFQLFSADAASVSGSIHTTRCIFDLRTST